MNTLMSIELRIDYANVGTYAARIRRGDGLLYDPVTKIFKTAPANPFTPLVPGTGDDALIVSAKVNTEKWTDGDYVICFHRTDMTTKMLVSMVSMTVFNGTSDTIKPVTSTEVAIRMMGITLASHKSAGSLGASFNLWHRQLEYICKHIESMTVNNPRPR